MEQKRASLLQKLLCKHGRLEIFQPIGQSYDGLGVNAFSIFADRPEVKKNVNFIVGLCKTNYGAVGGRACQRPAVI